VVRRRPVLRLEGRHFRFRHEEGAGAMMGEAEGKRRGWRPLRGGEGADGVAARRRSIAWLQRWAAQEGEGGEGVGQAGWEVEAQEEWRWPGRPGKRGQKGGPGRFGCSG
jgi:hypothetical protein